MTDPFKSIIQSNYSNLAVNNVPWIFTEFLGTNDVMELANFKIRKVPYHFVSDDARIIPNLC